MWYWFSCQTDNRWYNIESKVTPGHNFPTVALAACLHHSPRTPLYPTIQATLAAWSSLNRQYFTDSPLCRIKIPLAAYEHLIPGLSTQTWRKQGVHFSMSDLPEQDTMDEYKILQIKHYSITNKNGPIELPQILWHYLVNKNPTKHKGISLFYKFSTPLNMHIKIPNMVKWEKELQK